MDTRSHQETEKQRDRARIAADLADFLRRGGVIEQLNNGAPSAGGQPAAHPHSPVSARDFADD